ncbi:ABC transporter ATP-binding protein [Salibacterium salarium]|uniref:ABC transporter ATP-binding protein n=1 Tax=Salibacterium salarium TaxID=284579 RepID=A0A428N170_9BACI|nr:ABC transporter ATP-binding protein [Salibacterium salarium]RSL32150.1 ABC transporter ATP-binding protein [Salibacterium salarium]
MIETMDLSVRYPMQNQPSLPPVDLQVERGEKILLLGASGSGKSTLALALQGLIPRSIDAEKKGSVLVQGMPPESWSIPEACQHLGILFQDPETQFCMVTVEEEIIFGLENIGLASDDIESRLEESLTLTGLTERRHESLHHLSGGLKQKAAIACLLALDPEALVLDEPTANLDPQSTEDILQLWMDIAARKNKTLIFIEHKLGHLLPDMDRVIALSKHGGVIAEGTPREVFHDSFTALEQEGIWIPTVCREALKLEEEGIVRWNHLPLSLEEWETECAEKGIEKPVESIITEKVKNNDQQPLLEIENLSFSYRNHEALTNVHFTLYPGEFAALAGSNGAGKSTLAKILSGIQVPTSGSIKRKGKPSKKMRTDDIMKQTGFVFQNPEHQFICDTVEDEITYGWRIAGVAEEEWARDLEEMLDMFQLTDKRHENPFSLSQGQKRRLSVATMLSSNQELLLLDEPTFGQDEANTTALMNILKKLHLHGKTILMITHDMELIDQYADRVLLLDDGMIKYDVGTDTFFNNTDLLQHACVQVPVTRYLKQWRDVLERQEAPC